MSDNINSELGITTQLAPEPSMMRPARTWPITLLFFHGDNAEIATLHEGKRLVLGRDPTVDLPVLDERLSRRHAFFEAIKGEVWVEDLKSTNGTKLNGRSVKRARLLPGGEVRLGSVRASIHVRASAAAGPAESHESFVQAIAREASRAQTFGRGFAVLTAKYTGTPPGADPWRPLRKSLRPVDHLAPYSAQVAEILLAEADLDYARSQAEGMAKKAGCRCGIALYPDISRGELIRSSLAALRLTSAENPIQIAADGEAPGGPPAETAHRGWVVDSPIMRELHETVGRLAKAMIPVLLVGETGTGKEVLAQALHEGGTRSGGKMASINCAAIPATLVESVLFGHAKGAFTGAATDSPGLFEEAHGGTAFLDEIGELSASAQAALLRVLETKRVRRVGSSQEITVDVRVVAATHRDLEVMCAEGTFRQDLLYRINTMVLQIPPLRERPEEIAKLCELFLAEANAANGTTIVGIEREAMLALHQHPWPGNVRELRNVIERAVVITRGRRIALVDLPEQLRSRTMAIQTPSSSGIVPADEKERATPAAQPTPPMGPQAAPSRNTPAIQNAPAPVPEPGDRHLSQEGPTDFKSCMERVEVSILLDALRRADGNRKKAAKLLQMPLRTLSHKLSQHSIKQKGFIVSE